MIKEIRIQNLAIVAESFVEFDCGFNVLTGETGAGKSILVDSIGFLAGKRASASDVRHGSKSAIIEGVLEFESKTYQKIKTFLEAAGIPVEEDSIFLRRVIFANGKSRAFVNSCNWTVSGLAELSRYWLDVTGQHGQHELLSSKKHLDVLDDFGNCENERKDYEGTYSEIKTLEEDFLVLKKDIEQTKKDQEYLEFQLKEFEQLDVEEDEVKALEESTQQFSHSEKRLSSVKKIQNLIDGDQGVSQSLSRLLQELIQIQKVDPSLSDWKSDIEALQETLNSLSIKVSSYESKLHFDPQELEELNERLARVQKFSRKYGSLKESLLEKKRIETQIKSLEDFDWMEKEYIHKRTALIKILEEKAKSLSQKRKQQALVMQKNVSIELAGLGMKQARLSIEFMPVSENGKNMKGEDQYYSRQGAENIRFLFCPNAGEGQQPLDEIASGGELSRILLAIKSVGMLSLKYQNKTFLFDEVDTGIGGETAERVGMRMKALAFDGRQVLCVTHLAQVACYADHHLKVEKRSELGRTQTNVRSLSKVERQDEVARMIGGIDISKKVLAHAKELLKKRTG